MNQDKSVRKVLRAQITRNLTKLKALNSSTEVLDMNVILEELNITFDKIEQLTNNIISQLSDDDDIENELNSQQEYVAKVSEARVLVANAKHASHQAGVSRSLATQNRARLPKLEIPCFSGDPINFQSFFEMFQCSVDKNSDLSDIEKFTYLKGCLKGDAANCIDGLNLSSTNYGQAMKILYDRYGSPEKQIKANVKNLLKIESIKSTKSGHLRHLVDKIAVHVRALAGLGVASDQYGCFLQQIVLSRLPDSLRLQWARHDKEDDMGVDDLMKFLEQEARAIENTLSEVSEHVQATDRSTKFVKQSKIPFVNSSFGAKTNISRSFNCTICDSASHNPTSCNKINSLSSVDDRHQLIREKHLCFNCFGKHFLKDCSCKTKCKKCNGSHHTLLHRERVEATSSSVATGVSAPSATNSHASILATSQSILPVVPVQLMSASREKTVFALIDSGSDLSFIDQGQIEGVDHRVSGSKSMQIYSFGGHITKGVNKSVVLRVKSSSGPFQISVFTTPHLAIQNNAVPCSPESLTLLKEHGVSISQVPNKERISMIIGNDNFYQVITGKRIALSRELFAIETIFGWCLHGCVYNSAFPTDTAIHSYFAQIDIENLEMPLRRLWEVEATGTLEKPPPSLTSTHAEAPLKLSDNRYQVGFLWKEDRVWSCDYEEQASVRLKHNVNRLRKLGHLEDYHNIFTQWLSDGIIERVDVAQETSRKRVLPHHAVIKKDGVSTKIRCVLDASAKLPGDLSLNECLDSGENLFPSLLAILLRFRVGKFAVCGDVRQAFLMISLNPADRDSVSFFWYDKLEDIDSRAPVLYRMARLPFGVKCSPHLLTKTINHHLFQCNHIASDVITKIRESLYVDDLVTSADKKSDISQLITVAKDIFSDMNMELHKWHSNESSLHEVLQEPPIRSSVPKIFGVKWDTDNDTLAIAPPSGKVAIHTKRQLLSYLCSIWDPLGICTPFVIALKIQMQQTWKCQLDWDDQLPHHILVQVENILRGSDEFHELCISRWLFGSVQDKSFDVQLHLFVDASELAYGCVIYCCVLDNGQLVRCKFVASRARLAPLKPMTIPRLELLAALIGARFLSFISENLHMPAKLYAWSDSQVVLAWIRNSDKRYEKFLETRLQEIRELVPIARWQFIRGTMNPADLVTRGMSLPELRNCSLWWNGPPTLNVENNKEERPVDQAELPTISQCVSSSQCVASSQLPSLVDLNRFSSFSKLVRVVAYVFRFIRVCRRNPVQCGLTSEELSSSRTFLIKECQQHNFRPEAISLEEKSEVHPGSRIRNLDPFLDPDGLMRVGGRLQESDLPYNRKHPIILPPSEKLTELLVLQYHIVHLHAGVSSVMCELRQTFWIVRFRATVKRVIGQCMFCKRYKYGKKMDEKFAPLPKSRVGEENFRAFSEIGLDYMGPFRLKVGKAYILIITCLKIRAIHLEVTLSLDLNAFLFAFERFAARRSYPQLVMSDNAKTFKAASVILAETKSVSWVFNTEKAPWAGGVWERLVRSTKEPMRLTMRNLLLDYVPFVTLVCQVESVLNRRPITYVSSDAGDSLPLRPIDMLVFESTASSSDVKGVVLEHILQQDKHIKFFFKRWKEEYLASFLSNANTSGGKKLEVGEVVLLAEGNKRTFWPLARIEKLLPGRDGLVRTIILKHKNKLIRRSVRLICPLEIA